MKKLLTILCLVLLVSCSEKKEDDMIFDPFIYRFLEIGGVLYHQEGGKWKKEREPVTGVVLVKSNGGIGYVVERNTYKNGIKNGPFLWFYKNGQLWRKGQYKSSSEEGFFEKFYDNGQLMDRGTYKNGKLDGFWEGYYENGQLKYKINYKNGKREGLLEWFDENGKEENYSPRCYENNETVDMSYCEN